MYVCECVDVGVSLYGTTKHHSYYLHHHKLINFPFLFFFFFSTPFFVFHFTLLSFPLLYYVIIIDNIYNSKHLSLYDGPNIHALCRIATVSILSINYNNV